MTRAVKTVTTMDPLNEKVEVLKEVGELNRNFEEMIKSTSRGSRRSSCSNSSSSRGSLRNSKDLEEDAKMIRTLRINRTRNIRLIKGSK